MYKKQQPTKTTLKVNNSYEGETIEKKINRIVNNKEPIKDGAPVIYTDRKDGVRPEYDIRSDRFEIALEATDHIAKTHLAKRQEFHDSLIKKNESKDSGAEPTQGTNTDSKPE